MIEIFKTTIGNREEANFLVNQLQENFVGLTANVDLEDCDKILRICFETDTANMEDILHFLNQKNWMVSLITDQQGMPAGGNAIA